MRPFRFGVQAFAAPSATAWRDLARRAEDLGYSTLSLSDHYLGPGPASAGSLQKPQQLAPISAMAVAAACTDTLRIGCRVFCVDYHVPAVLAKEAATLDFLSDGRLELGLGAGWYAAEYAAMGLSFDSPARRVAKLEEVVALVKAQWTGEQLDCDGRFAKALGYRALPQPVQPRPSIVIGGARKRVLSLAAREADIVSVSNVPWEARNELGLTPRQETERRIGFVREAAGDRFAELDVEISAYYCEITDRIDEAVDRLTATMRDAQPEVVRDHPNVLVGSVGAVVDRLEARRRDFGFNYVTIPRELLDAFAPVVDRLAGR